MALKGRTPNKAERRHMDAVTNLGCVVCLLHYRSFSPAEIHHVFGKTRKDSHLFVLPLCFSHHREGNAEGMISRHPYKARFQAAYGSEEELLQVVKNLLANKET